MRKKYLRVTMGDGSKWDIPARLIAEDRARYYTKRDTGKESGIEFDKAFEELIADALEDTYEIIDWASNNMNWSDVEDVAENASVMEVDFQEGWVNGEKEVIEKETKE